MCKKAKIKVLGIVGVILVVFMIGLYFSSHLSRKGMRQSERKSLMIMVEGAAEAFEINLTEKSTSEMSFEQFLGDKLQISGRKDTEHGYFEGKVAWNGQKIYIVNLENSDSAELKEDIRSFMLGDYYVSTGYDAEKEEMEILIFYCP